MLSKLYMSYIGINKWYDDLDSTCPVIRFVIMLSIVLIILLTSSEGCKVVLLLLLILFRAGYLFKSKAVSKRRS